MFTSELAAKIQQNLKGKITFSQLRASTQL